MFVVAAAAVVAAALSGGTPSAPADVDDLNIAAVRQLQSAGAWDASEVATAASLIISSARRHSLGGLVTNAEADTLLDVVGQLCEQAVFFASSPPPPPPVTDVWVGGAQTWLGAACAELGGRGFVQCGQHCVPRRLCFPTARPVSRPCDYLPGMLHCGLGRGGSCIPRGSSCTYELLTNSFNIFAAHTTGDVAIEMGNRALTLPVGALSYSPPAPTLLIPNASSLNASQNTSGHGGTVGNYSNATGTKTSSSSLAADGSGSSSWGTASPHQPLLPPTPPPYIPRYRAFSQPPPPPPVAGLCLVAWTAGSWPRPAQMAPQLATAPLPPGPYGANALPVRQNVSLLNGSVVYSLRTFGGLSLRLGTAMPASGSAQQRGLLRVPLREVLQPLPDAQHRRQLDHFRYCAFHEPALLSGGKFSPAAVGSFVNGSNDGNASGGVSLLTNSLSDLGGMGTRNISAGNTSSQPYGTWPTAVAAAAAIQEDAAAWEWQLPESSIPSVEALTHPFGCSKLLGGGQMTPTVVKTASCTIPNGELGDIRQ